jgi:hypothetical protein
MYWLFLLFAAGALAVAFTTGSTAVLALCLLVSLACFVAWALGFYSARVGSIRDNAAPMIDPLELHRLREQAAARKTAAAAGQAPPGEA